MYRAERKQFKIQIVISSKYSHHVYPVCTMVSMVTMCVCVCVALRHEDDEDDEEDDKDPKNFEHQPPIRGYALEVFQ